jgi:hypothetical protein
MDGGLYTGGRGKTRAGSVALIPSLVFASIPVEGTRLLHAPVSSNLSEMGSIDSRATTDLIVT